MNGCHVLSLRGKEGACEWPSEFDKHVFQEQTDNPVDEFYLIHLFLGDTRHSLVIQWTTPSQVGFAGGRMGSMMINRPESGRGKVVSMRLNFLKKWPWWIRFPGYFVIFLVFLAAFGMVYQGVATGRDRQAWPPPGTLVDVGGYALHLNASGAGGPTVVLESGMGHTSLAWCRVREEIAGFTRVCTYDRAGLGWSERGDQPRDSRHIAQELHTLLERAAIPGPYILVGHSSGGLHVRVFADRYPELVAGMVLVDPSHEEQNSRFPAEYMAQMDRLRFMVNIQELLVRLGIFRLAGLYKAENLPDEHRAVAIAHTNQLAQVKTAIAELDAFDLSIPQAAATGDLGDKPLVVLTAGKEAEPPPGISPEMEKEVTKLWFAMHEELAGLSSNGKRIISPKSGHMIQLEDPGLVIDVIREMVAEIRKKPGTRKINQPAR